MYYNVLQLITAT